jgi:hypothetical protein
MNVFSKLVVFILILSISGILYSSPFMIRKYDDNAVLFPGKLEFENDKQKTTNSDMIKKIKSGRIKTASVAWWGFDKEDSTKIFQAAIDSNAKRILVPNMTSPWILGKIFLRSNQEIIFENGAELKAKKGEFLGKKDSLLNLININNVAIYGYGASLAMNKEDYTKPPYEKAEWRHGINLRGANNVSISGLTIRDTGGDGIYVGTGLGENKNGYCRNIHIRDVVCDNNFRQGISVISVENLLLENSALLNTNGTPPEAGIDFEPNSPNNKLVNIIVRNCDIRGNFGKGIDIHFGKLKYKNSDPVSFYFYNNKVYGRSVEPVAPAIRFSSHMTLDTLPEGKMLFFDTNIIADDIKFGRRAPFDKIDLVANIKNEKSLNEAYKIVVEHMNLRFNVPEKEKTSKTK